MRPPLPTSPWARRALVVSPWWLLALCLALWAAGSAEAQATRVAPDGLPGGQHVPSAFAAGDKGAALVSLELAHTEALASGANSHERVQASVAAGVMFRRWLALSAALTGRYDIHHGGPESDGGLATSTRIATRHSFDLGPKSALGLATGLAFPAADSLSRGLKALSPEASLVGSHALFPRGELSLKAGYRHDRSQHAVAEPFALSADDRLAAQLASYDTALLGALLAGRAGKLAWSLEWSWDVGVGSGAPEPLASPMRVELAAQALLRERVLVGGHLGASPSSRPAFSELVRIEPRFWLGVSCGLTFGREPSRPQAAPARATQSETTALAQRQSAELRVLDADGRPVADARIRVGDRADERTVDAEGRAVFEGPAGDVLMLHVTAEGFQPGDVELVLEAGETRVVTLERKLPEGEIKGSVRSLRGGPLVATITVMELERSVTSAADGTFRVDVPPGSYTVRISAEGHEAQERPVRVEQLGVAILVIDLRRSSR
jgi:hypothetical protein